MNDIITEPYLAALAAVAGGKPRDLEKRAEFEAVDRGYEASPIAAFVDWVISAEPNDRLRQQFHLSLATWDSLDTSEVWVDGTAPRTPDRRHRVYQLLGIPDNKFDDLDKSMPLPYDSTVVISSEFKPWYTSERRSKGAFYWPAYSKHLLSVSNWTPESVASLDDATSKVIERLSDPEREEPYRSKGLVVGYVQSGKTANFTGVVAKSIDAGYRLVIILTGTVDLLREQTQRRFDMELVGQENIVRGIDRHDTDLMRGVDYQQDEAWASQFLQHGFLPSTHGFPDIIRLTRHRHDFQPLVQGIIALEFEKSDQSKKLWDPRNLPFCNVRLVIVKKNHTVLQKLARDLRKAKTPLNEVPTLIIDDESDQASVNVSNPKKWKADTPERRERNAINRDISELLDMLPRAQYVGYTATPFANVFIDPSDSEDIFPTDFIIGLERPPGYMGVSDFHDLDPAMEDVEKTIANSNERAHVRSLEASGHGEEAELAKALDAFVLTGAIKLYRQSVDSSLSFRHHTMLIHQSVKQAEHLILAAIVKRRWNEAGFVEPSGTARLRALYENDFLPVCEARPDGPIPASFTDLTLFIGKAVARITEAGDNPVIIVNGDTQITEDVSFDTRPVWRILLGGTKLSRGFTVEGLCITYYRRKTKQADTLMQMGRWFGFRRGYQDLVRLYIARNVADGKRSVDLYEAFEAIVKDEEKFRSQLRNYSVLVNDKGQTLATPRDIPPLVFQHLPWLRPTAKNKMFNARLVVRRITGSLVIPYGYPEDIEEREHNYRLVAALLENAVSHREQLKVPAMKNMAPGTFDAYWGKVDHQDFARALRNHKWIAPEYFDPEIKHLEQIDGDIDDWLVIMPQLENITPANLPILGKRSLFKRGIRENRKLWGEPTDRKHRPAAELLAGARDSYGDEFIDGLKNPRRGAILVYPMYDGDKGLPSPATKANVILALAWIVPVSARRGGQQVIEFVARNSEDERAPIVDKVD